MLTNVLISKMTRLINPLTILIVISSLSSISANESLTMLTSYPNCSKIQQFAISLTDFSYCSLMYTVPHNLCQKCFKEFQNLGRNYDNLVNGEFNATDLTCPEDVITRDKLRHIHNYYESTKRVWVLGNCDNCYDSSDGDVSNIVVNFSDKLSAWEACVSEAPTNETCRQCQDNYTELNLYFYRLDADYGSSLCNDIADVMNLVHVKWNDDLHCKVQSGFDYATLSIALLVSVIPLIFYLIGRVYCRAKGPALLQQKRLSSQCLEHEERSRLLSPVLASSIEQP